MTVREWITGNFRYLYSLLGEDACEQESKTMRADLHAHPYVRDSKSLSNTIAVLLQNRISILPIVVHGLVHSHECDFWRIKEMLDSDQFAHLERHDLGQVVRIHAPTMDIVFTSGYENSCYVNGVDGRLDLVVICAEKGCADHFYKHKKFEDKIAIARDYGGIVIAAHPYTLHNPEESRMFLKFRLAQPQERQIIRDVVFPLVDAVDLVATNVAWMTISNRYIQQDYPRRVLCTSDAHCRNSLLREDLGKAGCIFPDFPFSSGEEFKRTIAEHIRNENFDTYFNYISPFNFMKSIVLYQLSYTSGFWGRCISQRLYHS